MSLRFSRRELTLAAKYVDRNRFPSGENKRIQRAFKELRERDVHSIIRERSRQLRPEILSLVNRNVLAGMSLTRQQREILKKARQGKSLSYAQTQALNRLALMQTPVRTAPMMRSIPTTRKSVQTKPRGTSLMKVLSRAQKKTTIPRSRSKRFRRVTPLRSPKKKRKSKRRY